ncbi:MAG: gamma-glutamyltransferase family protein [Cytophagales bacterium]|nr:gamma-glutamyltransferase family protein [Cytophagales bacterium]
MKTFNPINPYATPRLPLFARHAVATSHPLAAQAGLHMMMRGGNAVDAAIASAAMLTITEPVSNGLGSDAFCILWDPKTKALHGLNASGRAPAAWDAAYFKRKYGQAQTTPPKRGIDSVTVPGAVAGWMAMSERFGKLPFADLLQPAIDVAERGYLIPTVVQQKWAAAAPELGAHSISQGSWNKAFLPWGRAPNVGELFQFKAAARGLRSIAESKGESFYQGAMAEALVAFSKAQGGAMTLADLAHFKPEWVTPISQEYGGYHLHEIPPNGQGLAALVALGILKHFDLASFPVDSVASTHLQIEAMKLAFADIYRYVAEPSAMRVTSEQLLDSAYLQGRAKLIDAKRAQSFGAGNPVRGGTVYLTTADEDGMMVSFIQSNYMGFGSGCVEPNFGISLQNRGHGFHLNPASENCVAPRKRPFHTIIPAFLTKKVNGILDPVMSFGVMGANMQPQGHIQTLIRMLDYGQNPQAACDAPRWRLNAGLEINVEASMNASTVQGLKDLGHQTAVINDSYQDFGAGQFIWRMGDPKIEGYQVASDPRRDGQAVGF